MKQETIELENDQELEEVQVVQKLEQEKKVQHEFDLNKTFYYENEGEIYPGDGFVQETEKEKKVQHEFDLNSNKIYFVDGELHPDKEMQKFIVGMFRLYMPGHF